MNVDFRIEGMANIKKNMMELEKDVRLKGARFAGRKASNVIRDAAIANAEAIDDSETANSIAKNIVVQFATKTFKRTGDVMFRIGVRGGAKTRKENEKNAGGDTFYWRFLEFGTSKMEAKPFLKPAMTDNIDKATNVFVSEFDRWLTRAVKRMKKK